MNVEKSSILHLVLSQELPVTDIFPIHVPFFVFPARISAPPPYFFAPSSFTSPSPLPSSRDRAVTLFHLSVGLLIIPISSSMLHFRPRGSQNPPKPLLNILHEMARKLHMPHVRRMILRADIIVLEDSCRVEIMHEPSGGELLVDGVDFLDKGAALGIGVADGTEAVPEGYQDYLGGWVGCVDCIY